MPERFVYTTEGGDFCGVMEREKRDSE